MALEKNIKINVETNIAKKNMEGLTATIQEQKDITLEFERELRNLEEQLAKTSKGSLAEQKQIKDQITTVKSALKDQRLSLRELNNEKSKSTVATNINTKSLSENYGVVQLLDQVTGGLASQVRSVVDANRLFNISLKGTKTALIATGIGAFVVALGLVVAYWDDIVRFVTQTNEKLEEQNKLIDSQLDVVKLNLETNTLLEKSLIAQGKSVDEILKVRDRILQSEQLLLVAKLQNLIQQRSLLKSKAEELSFAQRIGEQELKNQGIDIGESKADISEEDRLALLELDKQITQTNNALINLGITRDALANPGRGSKDKETKDNGREDETSFLDELLEAKKEEYEQYLFAESEYERSRLELIKMTADEEVEIRRGSAEEMAAIKEMLINQDQEVLDAKVRALGIVTDLAGAESDVGRASLLAKQAIAAQELLVDIGAIKSKATRTLAEASMDGAKATSGVATGLAATLALGFPAAIPALVGYAAAAAGIVTGVVSAVKGAKSVASEYGGGSGGATQSPRPVAPSFNLVQGSASNQIANSVQSGTAPVKSYVVSKDVTSNQELDRQIQEGATL